MSVWSLDLPERATATCPDNFGIASEHEHETEREAFDCYEAQAQEADAEALIEQRAENAWLRAAEAGTPDTWADEERERQIEAWGPAPF